MDNLSTETIALMITYLLPGFIINTMFSYAFPIEKDNSSNIVLRYIFFGVLNYILIYFIDFLSMGNYLIKNPNLIFIIRTILMPVIIGIALIYLSNIQTFRKLLGLIGLSSINIIPTAWDYIFHRISNEGGSYLTITLKDYQEIYGFFNDKSFASSLRSSSNNDIYLDKIYKTNSFTDEFATGILISQEDILTINFHEKGE